MRTTFFKKACALLLVVTMFFTMSSTAFAASFSIRYDADISTADPADFGTSAADGRIWADKSVEPNPNGGFDVTLSALAQEYISNTATLKPGGSEEKPLAADVTFILDMSTSMSAYTDVDDGDGNVITRLAAMVAATNDAIAIIMDANPENRVAIHWFGNSVSSVHVGTFLDMASYRLTNGTAYLSVTGSTVKTTGYVQKLGTNGKYSAVSTVSVSTGAGTPIQNGIVYGIQKTIADINGKTTGSIGARQPYVFVLSDGAASIGNADWWKTPSSPTAPGSYKSLGKLTGNVSTGSKEVAAATILAAAYQRDLLVSAYKNYNGGTDYPITFYTVGLGPDSAINGASNYAWCALNPTALNTYDNATGNNPSSTAATTTKSQIVSYVNNAGMTYNKYASPANYTFSTYYQYADTYPKLDTAFTKLAVEVEAATQAVTMPTMTLENATAGGSDCAMVFTDTLGEGMVLNSIKLGNVTGNLSGGMYTFSGLQSTATVSGNVVTWNVAANDMRSHVYKIADPKATTITYTPPSSPLKLTYNVKLAGTIAPDTGIYSYLTGSDIAPATARFSPTRDNPHYTYVNKYVGNVGKLSEIGYPSIDGDISHYVKGSVIGAQAAGTVLNNVYVTSAMVEAASVGTFTVSDVGRILPSVTMPEAGAYQTALSASLRNCIVATGSDTLLTSSNFAFRSGIIKQSGTVTADKSSNVSGTFGYAAQTTYNGDGSVTTKFGNNGKMSLELGIALSAPKNVTAGGYVTYGITLYNYTNSPINGVSVALDSDMTGSYTPIVVQGFSLPTVGSLDGITVPAAAGTTPGEITVTSVATVSASSGASYNAEAMITKIDGASIAAEIQPTSNTVNVTVMDAGYGAEVEVKKDGVDWLASPVITLDDGGGTPITDLTDVSAGRYEILEGGVSTGVYIDVDGIVPTVTIDYYTLNIVAGEGIDSVAGGGIYLAGREVEIDAVVNGLQPTPGTEGDSATIYGVGGIDNGDLALNISGDWSAYRFAGWTTNNSSFTVPTDQKSTITMPAYGLTLIANATDSTPSVDVQGKVVDGSDIPKYKIDIEWGAMTFDYSTGNRWNPDDHAYTGGQINAWLPDSFFQDGNNLITTYNHSNADVRVSFGVSNNVLDGVDMIVTQTNSSLGALAEDVLLTRVEFDGDPIAPSIPAYLWLTGSPTSTNGMDKYIKAAVITVTIEAVAGSGLTPKKTQ